MIRKCAPHPGRHILAYLEERFGLPPACFASFQLYEGPGGRIFLGPRRLPPLPTVVTGFLIARLGSSIKPATNLLQLFGKQVTRNTVMLTRDQTLQYLQGEDVEVRPEQKHDVTDGYVLVKHGQYPLGCGLLKGSRLKNMMPRAKRREVLFL